MESVKDCSGGVKQVIECLPAIKNHVTFNNNDRFVVTMKARTTQKTCEDCQDWRPLDLIPFLGECYNPVSVNYRRVVFQDAPTGTCFEKRTLKGLEFAWCRTCRETVSFSDIGSHRKHKLFVGAAQLPAEELVEVTLAG